MSTTVDNRVVQMRFDNEEFEKKASKSLSTLDRLKNALKFSGASKNLDKVNESFKEIDANPLLKAIEGINGGFTTMVAKATLVNRATNALIDTTKRFVSSMTLDQVNAGWDKYAEKTSAVQTIMAATSKDFKDTGVQMNYVNGQLEKLNWFTDETSYNFTEMVNNIGKFTSNGIKLDKSVTAMQGIATWAARSGANANEASRAMYNLSQALSTGAVKLIDWKSIENANMATAEFKENAIEAAVALGTLKKKGDGTYVTMKNNAVSVQNFNNALSDAWFTSDVLLSTLDKYGGFTDKLYEVSEETGLTATELLSALEDYKNGTLNLQKYASEAGVSAVTLKKHLETLSNATYELGRKSFRSAQEAKTFGEAISATSDAVSTKWMKTFEIIFGDYEEARVLWTDFANVLYDIFAASLDTRNELLTGWKELGGRSDLLEGLRAILDTTSDLIAPIRETFRTIFPEKSAIDLYNLTEKFRDFALSLKVTNEYASQAKRISSGFFSAIDIGRMALKGLLGVLRTIANTLKPLAAGAIEILAKIGDSITKLHDNLQRSNGIGAIFERISSGIEKSINSLVGISDKLDLPKIKLEDFGGAISTVYGLLKPLGVLVKNVFGETIRTIADVFSSTNGLGSFDTLFSAINIGGSIAIFTKLSKLIKLFSSPMKSGSGAFDAIKKAFDTLGETIESWKTNKIADTLKTIAISIGILSASLFVLSSINPQRLTTSLIGISALFTELISALKSLSEIASIKMLISMKILSGLLISISGAIFILATAVKNMSSIGWEGLIKGLGSVMVLLVALSKSMTTFSGKNITFMKGASGLIALALAIRILTNSIKALSDLGIGELAKGLVSVGVLLAALAVFSQKSGKMQISSGIGFIALAGSLVVLSQAIRTLSELSIGELAKGLVSITVALVAMTAAVNLLPKNAISAGTGLLLVSTGLLVISQALSTLGNMTIGGVIKSLIALGGALAVLVVAVKALSGTLSGIAAITLLSTALIGLSVGLKLLGSMSLGEIGKSLLTLVASFGAFGIAALALAPVIPAMIALAGAMTLLGVASAGVGAGILALSAGLGYLSTVSANGINSVIQIFKSIIELIPYTLEQVGIGLSALAETIGEHVPEFVTAGLSMVVGLIKGISDKMPELVTSGINIVLEFLRGVAEKAESISEAGIDIILSLLSGIASKTPDIANTAFDVVITFINAVGTTVKDRTPELVAAFINLGKDVIAGLVNGLLSGVSSVINAVKDVGSSAINTLRKVFRSHSPSEETDDIGHDYDDGLVNGIVDGKGRVIGAAQDLASSAVKATRDTLNESQLKIYNGLVDVWSKRTRDAKKAQAAVLAQQKEAQEVSDKELLDKQDAINRELKKKWYQRSKDLKALSDATLATNTKTTTESVDSDAVSKLSNTISNTVSAATSGSSSSLKASGAKAADTFLTAFENKLSDLDLDLSTIDLEQSLWEATIGQKATDQEKQDRETEVLTEKIKIQNEKVDQANQKYEYTVKKLGKTSEDAKKAYQELLQEQIDLANLMNSVNQTRDTAVDNSTDAMVAYAQYIAESKDDLLKLGFTMEQISAAASEQTGYNLQNTTQNMTDSVATAVTTAMSTVQSTYAANAESTLGALTSNFASYGAKYSTAVGSGMTSATSAVTEGAKNVATAAKSTISGDYSQWYSLGQMCAEGFKQGILSKSREIADAAAAVANAAFSAVQVAIDSHSPSKKFMWLGEMAGLGMSIGFQNMEKDVAHSATQVADETITAARDTIGQLADIIDTDPTLHPQIAPVVDLTQVRSGFSKLGSMKTPVISTYVTGARVNAVASSLSSHENGMKQPVPQNNQNGPQVVEFVQNNYSPKALSRSEIYRNTNNQFTAFKEAISKV